MDLTQLLPEDVLADVLSRVAPRSLAACRCVCKSLRSVIDARQLLRTDLLPLSVGGIFLNFYDIIRPEYFSRPSTRPTISGSFDYVPPSRRQSFVSERRSFHALYSIQDHCNGLLLLEDCVVNPATRQWDPLPLCPALCRERGGDFTYEEYLVFDPTVSPHYEVFIIPRVHCQLRRGRDELDSAADGSDWPPSLCALHVFSSRSGCWEERSYIREGKPAGTIADMRRLPYWGEDKKQYAVYWRGALYVHCQTNFIMRISLSDDKYKVIKPPTHTGVSVDSEFHLGRSKNGVYIASICWPGCRLLVWVLEESHGNTSWVLRHSDCLDPRLKHQDYSRPVLGPWVLQDINFEKCVKYYEEHDEPDDGGMEYMRQRKFELNCNKEELVEEKFEWDSENDDLLDEGDTVGPGFGDCVYILGFHPFKEVVFVTLSLRRVLAYHLKDSKIQDLGYLYPTSYYEVMSCDQYISESFTYTPCWIEHQKANKNVEGHPGK